MKTKKNSDKYNADILICSLWGRIKDQSYQLEIIATK